jgi:hypothetical protein
MIGTTRARVSFFMNKFRKLGFISYNGKIEVHSSLLSIVLYDPPQTDGAKRASQKGHTRRPFGETRSARTARAKKRTGNGGDQLP